MEEVSETPLRNRNWLVRLVQGQQPARPPATALGDQISGKHRVELLSTGKIHREPYAGEKRKCLRRA